MSIKIDYSLVGSEASKAVEKGLADAVWYTTPISRESMRELMKRKNWPGIRDSLIWFGVMIVAAIFTVKLWGTWMFIFPYMIYAVLYASTSDSRWHESSHGTVFKTDWLNNLLYEISSFMVLRQSTVWRWSHTRHHSDTLVRGRDPEIAVPRPPNFLNIFLNLFAIRSTKAELKKILIHASGRIEKEVATFLPESENKIVIAKARIYLLIFALVIGASIYWSSILPLMFIGIPTLVGSWLMPVYGMTQHSGLEENVLDHRINCRTVYMNFIHRFLYWNMNFHVEHHMYPMVPYHALPKLHKLMKYDCALPSKSLLHAWMEIIPALIKQRKDPSYFIKRNLPTSAAQVELKHNKIIKSAKDIDSKGLVEVCKSEDLPLNEVVRFDCDEQTFAIYRTSKKELYATEGICTHGNTHLADGMLFDEQIECPKHNGRFDVKDGSVQRQPVCIGLTAFIVLEKDGKIYLDLTSGKEKNKEESYEYKVVSNKNVATYIKELVLEPIHKDELIDYKPGDYIHLEIPAHQTKFETIVVDKPFITEWKEKQVFDHYAFNHTKTRRNYSFASNPKKDSQVRFNVRIALPPEGKNCHAGLGSTYVFNLKPGDIVKAAGPYGDFHIKESEKEMVYIGGGAGMAPLRSHISYLFDTLKTNRKVSYWYGARTKMELFYLDYFKGLADNNKNFSFQIALSDEVEDSNYKSGFIHELVEEEFLKKASDLNNKEFYLCGPPAMIAAVQKTLKQYKVPDENIMFDEF